MALSRVLLFWLYGAILGAILFFTPYQPLNVANHRIEKQLSVESGLVGQILSRCQRLVAITQGPIESFLMRRFSTPSSALDRSLSTCSAEVLTKHGQRLSLQSHYTYTLLVRDAQAATVLEHHFHASFPTLFSLWPFGLLLIAFALEFGIWVFPVSIAALGLTLSGGNLIYAFQLGHKALLTTLRSDLSLWTTLALLFWTFLIRDELKSMRPLGNRKERASFLSHFGVIGMISPSLFTLMSRSIYAAGNRLLRLSSLLKLQAILVGASLYLFSMTTSAVGSESIQHLLLPRYFFFGFALLILLRRESILPATFPSPSILVIARWLVASAIFPVLSLGYEPLQNLPSLLLIAIGLVLTEAAVRWQLLRSWKLWRSFFAFAIPLIGIHAISILCLETGTIDLVVEWLNPQRHPTILPLTTFAAGFVVALVSGSFSISFYALYTTLGIANLTPVIRASLLDGILAGILLSPFSVLNWIPSVLFQVPLSKTLALRTRDTWGAFAIAILICGVSSFGVLGILQPISFLVIILMAITFRIYRPQSQMGNAI